MSKTTSFLEVKGGVRRRVDEAMESMYVLCMYM